MKRVVTGLVLTILYAVLVSATLDITNDDLTFGSPTQAKSTDTKEITITQSFKVKALDTSFTGISYQFQPESNFNAAYLKKVNLPPEPWLPGTEYTVDVEIIAPEDFSSVDDDLKKTAFPIGDLKISGIRSDTGITNQSNALVLHLEVQNLVKLEKIELKQDSGTTTISSGGTYTVTADEDLTLLVTVKNEASNSTNIDLSEVVMTLSGDPADIGEEETIDGLDSGKLTTQKIDFSVDSSDSGISQVTVEISGIDEFDGEHGTTFDFNLDVKEESEEEITNDEDGDGVEDAQDLCPGTISQCSVDGDGCDVDTDEDGVCDELDPTPGEPQEEETTEDVELQQQLALEQRLREKEQEMNEEKDAKEEPEEEATSSGFVPFIFGFLFGLGVSVFFLFLIKS